MQFLAWMLIGLALFGIYSLISVVIRFIRRLRKVRRMKIRMNELIQKAGEGKDVDLTDIFDVSSKLH